MKKLSLLILCTLLVYITKAQSLSLSDQNNVNFNNGDTLLVTGTTNDYMLTTNLNLFNASLLPVDVLVKTENLVFTTGSITAFAFGTYMYPPFTQQSTNSWTVPASSVDPTFQAWFFPEFLPGSSFVRYTFFDQSNTNDSVSIVIEYSIQQSAGSYEISENNALRIYPNPCHGIFTIQESTDLSFKSTVEIYNINGSLILRKPTAEPIDISNEPAGIYLLSVIDLVSGYKSKIRVIKK